MGAWRYTTVNCVRIWRWYAHVGPAERAARILFPCARAAVIALPPLLVPGATRYGSPGGVLPAGLGYPLPVAELPYGGAWGTGPYPQGYGFGRGPVDQYEVARFLPALPWRASTGEADVGPQTWGGEAIGSFHGTEWKPPTEFPTTADHPVSVPEPAGLAVLVVPLVALAWGRRGA